MACGKCRNHVSVTDTVKEQIRDVLGAEDIQIISANRVSSSRKYGGSNTSNRKIMVKLESQNQRRILLQIAQSSDMTRGGMQFPFILT